LAVRPSGVGVSSTAPPMANGATARTIVDWRVRGRVTPRLAPLAWGGPSTSAATL
jgi:hypothetical protein